jgi:hypothetical protein
MKNRKYLVGRALVMDRGGHLPIAAVGTDGFGLTIFRGRRKTVSCLPVGSSRSSSSRMRGRVQLRGLVSKDQVGRLLKTGHAHLFGCFGHSLGPLSDWRTKGEAPPALYGDMSRTSVLLTNASHTVLMTPSSSGT